MTLGQIFPCGFQHILTQDCVSNHENQQGKPTEVYII
jgi:hypothetical protein